MYKFLMLISILFIAQYQLWAQNEPNATETLRRNCGSDEHKQYLEKKYPLLKESSTQFEKDLSNQIHLNRISRKLTPTEIITIPVVVHVIHNNPTGIIGGTNISDEQILSQIKVLNEDYRKKIFTRGYNTNIAGADTKIEFCLAATDPNCNPTNGITRHYSVKNSFDMNNDNILIKSFGYWPSDQYLNIWVCNIANDVIGYAQFPNYSTLPGLNQYESGPITDGVVIRSSCFGSETGTANKGAFKYGRTTTHEIGHWLGLKHIWGDYENDSSCDSDYCDDTPPQSSPSPSSDFFCQDKFSLCNGIQYKNMTENYMDYSADICMNIFTNDQNTRMQTVLSVSPMRKKLLTSKGCEQTKIVQYPLAVDFDQNLATDWQITNADTTDNLSKWTTSSPGAKLSNYAISCNQINSKKNGHYSTFDSPYVNFTNVNTPFLQFDIAYPTTPNNLTDTLILYYAKGCSSNAYTPMDTITGERLITTSVVASNFTPTESDWITIKRSLPFFKNSAQSRIRFKSISSKASTIFLDNITIFSLNTNCYVAENKVLYYDRTNLHENESAEIKIYDLNGKNIINLSVFPDKTQLFTYDLSFLASGMYLTSVTTNTTSFKNKFIITQ
jgi:hypothetical protein